jgi:hypothetical protein
VEAMPGAIGTQGLRQKWIFPGGVSAALPEHKLQAHLRRRSKNTDIIGVFSDNYLWRFESSDKLRG